MDIRKSNDNFKNRKPKCFNCNKYDYMAKEYWKKKKKKPESVSNVTKKDT